MAGSGRAIGLTLSSVHEGCQSRTRSTAVSPSGPLGWKRQGRIRSDRYTSRSNVVTQKKEEASWRSSLDDSFEARKTNGCFTNKHSIHPHFTHLTQHFGVSLKVVMVVFEFVVAST